MAGTAHDYLSILPREFAELASGRPTQGSAARLTISKELVAYCQANKTTLLLRQLILNESLPIAESLEAELNRRAIEASALRMALDQALAEVSTEFSRRRIPTACIKGPVSANAWYAPPTLREYRDLDLLVPREFLDQALEILHSLSYRLETPLSPRKLRSVKATQHALSLVRSDGRYLDLHWNLIESQFVSSFHMGSVWSQIREVDLGSVKVLTLGEADSCLFACVHAGKTLWLELRSLLDCGLALAALSPEKFSFVFERAKLFRLERVLLVSVRLTDSILGLPIATELKEFAQREPVSSIAERIEHHFFQQTLPSEIEHASLGLALKQHWSDKARYCIGRLSIPHEDDWNTPIPDSLFFLHYVCKPFKTSFRAAQSVVRRFSP